MTQEKAAAQTTSPRLDTRLRVLATTDLHAHILSWDYYSHRLAPNRGLSRIATAVVQARAECEISILLDNGDFLSGSGLADFVVRHAPVGSLHPMIAAMNALGYDAVNLGNHEFSHGLPFLKAALRDAQFPVLCTNFEFQDFPLVQRAVMIRRHVQGQDGKLYPLTIGIMGLLPAQTMIWEAENLRGQAQAQPMAQVAQSMALQLRQKGADVVIALAHTGLAGLAPDSGEDRHADVIAQIDGIDAVIAGHSHQIFPQSARDNKQKAIVSPGFFGSHLAVLDLDLQRDAGQWRVLAHTSTLRSIAAREGGTGALTHVVADQPAISALAQPWHGQILAQAQQVVGHLPHPVHSYFATIAPSSAMALIAQSQAHHLAQLLRGTPDAKLPVLSAVAPFKVGGRGGPENFTELPAGPFLHHHASDLYMHPNSFVAFRLSGREAALWLERSVSKYNQIPKNARDAELINADFPSFNCDMIHGLTYEIDLSQPAMFDTAGRLVNVQARRIFNLRYQGQPVQDGQIFALASNSYRRGGASGFAGTGLDNILVNSTVLVQDILRDFVASGRAIAKADPAHWRFMPMAGTSVVFESAPQARAVLGELAQFKGEVVGDMADGFTRFRLHL